MVKPRLIDVVDTLGVAIKSAINASGYLNDLGQPIPANVGPGTIIATELAQILGQMHGNSVVALWPLPGQNYERYNPDDTLLYTPQTVNLVATLAGNVITFSGQSDTAYNVHTVMNRVADAYVKTSAGDSLDTVASAVAAAISGAGLSGITASASGAAVTIAGDLFALFCNVGGTIGTTQREVMRIRRPVQATVYSPDPDTRTMIGDAIISAVGTSDNHFYALSDGQWLYARFGTRAGDKLVEKAQSSYSAFEDHIIFDTEYPMTVTSTVVQVGVVVDTTAVNNNAPVTAYLGG